MENFSAAFPNLGILATNAPGVLAFSTTNTCALVAATAGAVQELAVTLTPAEASLGSGARAGLAFNVRDEKNFDFFGLTGETSGWTLAQVRGGNFSVIAARGRPVRAGQDYRLGLRAGDHGLECLVNREKLFEHADLKLATAPVGLGVSGAGASFGGLSCKP